MNLLLGRSCIAALIIALIIGCKKKDLNPDSETFSLYLSTDTVIADHTSGSSTVTVTGNVRWTATVSDSWLVCDPLTDSAYSLLHITWGSMTADSFREATITLKANGVSDKVIYVLQEYLPPNEGDNFKLVSYSGSDSTLHLNDSIFFIFNKPITVNYVVSATNLCSFTLTPLLIHGGYGFEIERPACVQLADSFPFRYSVTSNENENLVDTATVKFFTRHTPTAGMMVDYILTDDNSTLWTSEWNPNKIEAVSVADGSVVKEIPLSFQPGVITLNTYNNLLYITHYAYTNEIEVYDPVSLVHVKTITIPVDDQMNQAYPCIYPTDITFASNGFGLVVLQSNFSSEVNLRIIDAAENDSIYYDYNVLTSSPQIVFTNFDKSQLLVEDNDGSTQLKIINSQTKVITNLDMSEIGLAKWIVPSRKENKIYAEGAWTQTIFDLTTGQHTLDSPFEGSDNCYADFSYQPGDNNIVFYLDALSSVFMLNNYNNQTSIININGGGGIMSPICTTDAKWVIMRGNKTIYFFDPKMFQ